MEDEEYMRPAETFLDWFKAWPETTFHDDIEFADLRARGAGRGIVAKADIAPDTVLFTIPRKAIISATTSELASLIPSISQRGEDAEAAAEGVQDESEGEDDEGREPWTSLILIMIYEFLRGDKSPWKPYFDVLPAAFDTPMFWTPEELAALQASPIISRVGKEEADAMIKTKVLPVIRAHSGVFFPEGVTSLSDVELMNLAHRMGSTIMAYSFSLENDEDEDDESDSEEKAEKGEDEEMWEVDDHSHKNSPECDHDNNDDDDDEGNDGWVEDKNSQIPLGMVPMADMLNADAEFNAHIHHGAEALTATAVRPIKAGDEILNYYGPLSNGELLRRYGYTTEKHEHFDAVDLPWALVQEQLMSQLGIKESEASKVIDILDADELEDPIMLDRDFDEDETTGRLTTPESGRVLTELPPTLRRQARAFVKLAMKRQQKKQEKEHQGRKNQKFKSAGKDEKIQGSEKEIVATAIENAISARLAAYPTSLEEDEAEFEKLSNDKKQLSGRRYSALRVRIGEKRLLAEAEALAKQAADAEKKQNNGKKKDKRSNGADEQSNQKKQKMNK